MGVDRWRSSRRGWVVTAAALTAMICLVGWPRPTLYVLGSIAAAVILFQGIRLLATERRPARTCGPERAEGHTYAYQCALKPPPVDPRAILGIDGQEPADGSSADRPAERCCVCGGPETPYANYRGLLFCWPCADCPCGQVPCVRTGINDPAVSAAAADPDASGQDPETGRAAPDDDRSRPADQAGDHPDVLRTRVATAIRHALKTRTLPAIVDYAGRPISGTAFGLTEHDLADVALTELAPELDELAALHQGEDPYTDEATVPTPAQWIWRWNHATPTERLEHAARAIARTDRLAAVYAVLIHASGRSDLTAADVNARIRAALNGTGAHVVHQTTEQQASDPQQVDESADDHGEAVQAVPTTPPLTGPMPATESPTCGSSLPSMSGIPCGDPATWHIRWAPGSEDDDSFPAGLACDPHMQQLARTTTWYERHPAGPDCGTRTANWTPERCIPAEEA